MLFAMPGAAVRMPAEPIGVVLAVGDFDAEHVDARVQISGFARPFVFDDENRS